MKINEIENYHYWKQYTESDMVVSSQEMWELLKNQPQRIINIPQLKILNSYLEGVNEGEIITISGLTKNGKTCLAQSITKYLSEAGINCLWFTYEVKEKQFLDFMSDGVSVPLFYMPQELKSGIDLAWIENKIKESIIKFKTRVIFIDHLHYLADMSLRNITPEIGRIMRWLKHDIAKKYGVTIFLMAHMNKVNDDREPSHMDIRDSYLISAESDVVLIILRLSEENRANLKVEFTRRTGVFQKKIKLIKRKFFEEVEDEKPKRNNQENRTVFGYSQSDD